METELPSNDGFWPIADFRNKEYSYLTALMMD